MPWTANAANPPHGSQHQVKTKQSGERPYLPSRPLSASVRNVFPAETTRDNPSPSSGDNPSPSSGDNPSPSSVSPRRDHAAMTAPHPEFRHAWPVIFACFLVAIQAWGFGFYGLSVFVARLQAEQGWSTALVSGATIAFYLVGAALITRLPLIIARIGPRIVLPAGVALMSLGAIAAGHATQPWHMVAGFLIMGAGWSAISVAGVAATIALWFDTRRGLAISIALNGASAAGFTIAPALVWLADDLGLARASLWLALGSAAIVIPLVLLGLLPARPAPPSAAAQAIAAGDPRPAFATQAEALRSWHFWSVAAPFAVILMAQVGFLVHLVTLLTPTLGARGAGIGLALVSIMAVLGRLALGLVIDRIPQRPAAAIGLMLQAAGLLLVFALPASPAALYTACVLYGLWVGNNITLPSLIIQREFAAPSFGLIVGLSTAIGQISYAFAPALLGAVHDLTGGYPAVLLLTAAMVALGAATLFAGAPRQP